MIFVTVGTHPGQFDRLVSHMDQIAGQISEKVIIQRGFTRCPLHHADYFDFAPDLNPYFSKARLVISHSATSLIEFVLSQKKPLITVPRQARYKEHLNDHQVEFAHYFASKTGIKAVINIEELTPSLLAHYKKIAHVDRSGFARLKHFLMEVINQYEKS